MFLPACPFINPRGRGPGVRVDDGADEPQSQAAEAADDTAESEHVAYAQGQRPCESQLSVCPITPQFRLD
ncbi:hypothetical protein SRHO_G00120750 [Serrasalmus rhombeus]